MVHLKITHSCVSLAITWASGQKGKGNTDPQGHRRTLDATDGTAEYVRPFLPVKKKIKLRIMSFVHTVFRTPSRPILTLKLMSSMLM